jgi:GTP1/Obg family GTP-binding protein
MLGDEEEQVNEASEDNEFEEIDKMAKFYKDLNAIKERNKEMKSELLKVDKDQVKLSKHEEKQVKKLLKEQDKLER